jgi:hypothetical protein
MNNLKKYIPILLLGIVAIVVFRRWISFDIFSSGDWGYYQSKTLQEYTFPTVWKSNFGTGSVDMVIWRAPYNLAQGLLAYFNLDQNVTEKFVMILPAILIGNLSIYLMLKSIFKSWKAAIVGAFVFNYNTYYFVSGSAYLLYAAGTVFVLSLYFYMQGILNRKYWYSILSSILLFLSGSYDLRVSYIGVSVIIFYAFFDLLVKKNVYKENFRSKLVFLGSFLGVFLTLNLYWVIALASSSFLTTNKIFSRSLFGNEFMNILNALTLQHPFWNGTTLSIFDVQKIIPYFWIYPILACIGFYRGIKNHYVVFFSYVCIIGIFLTKQVGEPFGTIYYWLFYHFPGFNAFREATKFYLLIILGYSVLIGSLIDWLDQQSTNVSLYRKYLANIAIIIISIILLWCTIPILTGSIESVYTPKQKPTDYDTVNDFMENDEEYFRTLWVPSHSRWSVFTNRHPIISGVEALNSEWSSIIGQLDIDKYSDGALVLYVLTQPNAAQLLSDMSVKYVVIPASNPQNDNDFFRNYSINKEEYESVLDSMVFLRRLNIGMKDIIVYKTTSFQPHFYIEDHNKKTGGNLISSTMSVLKDNQYEYRIKAYHLHDTETLKFAETYHPAWKMHIGASSWISLLFDRRYFISDTNHFRDQSGMNGYRLDINDICQDKSKCTLNADGGYDMNIQIYFLPQLYLFGGISISLSAFLLFVVYCTYSYLKDNYGEKP